MVWDHQWIQWYSQQTRHEGVLQNLIVISNCIQFRCNIKNQMKWDIALRDRILEKFFVTDDQVLCAFNFDAKTSHSTETCNGVCVGRTGTPLGNIASICLMFADTTVRVRQLSQLVESQLSVRQITQILTQIRRNSHFYNPFGPQMIVCYAFREMITLLLHFCIWHQKHWIINCVDITTEFNH